MQLQKSIFHNEFKTKLIKRLYGHSSLTVSDLSRGIGKSIPFTTSLVNEMVEEGILSENGLAESKGGRRAQLFSFTKNIFYTIGVSINQFHTTIAIFNLRGEQVGDSWSQNIQLNKTGEDLIQLGEFLNTCIEESALSKNQILGIGIGMPGFIDVNLGINHSFLNSKNKSLVYYLEELTNFPVFIDNDSSLIGLAEHRFGSAQGRENALVVNIGWGVGLGIIILNKVFRGNNGYAGEFSHIPLFENHKICSCGKTGCLETETSMNVLLEKAAKGIAEGANTRLPAKLPEDKTRAVKLIFEALEEGDHFSIELMKQIGLNLGRGLSILIHLFNPGLIVLSGFGSAPGRFLWASVQQAINEGSIAKLAEDTEIKISELGESAELIGSAALVIERIEELKEKRHKDYWD